MTVVVRDLGLNDLVADGIEDQLAHRLHMEFVHNSGAVVVYSPFTDMEGCTDFFVAFALGEQLDDFAFADAEPFVVTGKRFLLMAGAQMFENH